jgi:hypothetical protein
MVSVVMMMMMMVISAQFLEADGSDYIYSKFSLSVKNFLECVFLVQAYK